MKKSILLGLLVLFLILSSQLVFASDSLILDIGQVQDGYYIMWERVDGATSYYLLFYEVGKDLPFETKIFSGNEDRYSLVTNKKLSKISFNAIKGDNQIVEKDISLRHHSETGKFISSIIKEVRNSQESLFVILSDPNKYETFFVNFYDKNNKTSKILYMQKNDTQSSQGWIDNFIYFDIPKEDTLIELVGFTKNHLYLYDYYDFKIPKEEPEQKPEKEIITDNNEDKTKEEPIIKQPVEQPKPVRTSTFIFEVNYPKTKEVFTNSDIIPVNVNTGTLLDVKINNELVYAKIDSKTASSGIEIPLSRGTNNVEIRAYDNKGSSETFRTTIKYNSFFNFDQSSDTNIEDIEEIIISKDIELIFDKKYGDVLYENEQTRVRGKAKNADILLVNNNNVKIDNNSNFEFILKLKEGDNRVVFEASNEFDTVKEVIVFRYEKPENLVNVNELKTFEIPTRVVPNESENDDNNNEDIVFDNEGNENSTIEIPKSPQKYIFLGISLATMLIFIIITIKKNNFKE